MGMEHLVDSYTPVGDMISFLICVVFQVVIYSVLYFSQDSKFTYLKRSVNMIMLATVANIVFWLVCSNHLQMDWLLFLSRDIYHFSLICCLFLFLMYIRKMLDISGKATDIGSSVTRIFCLVAISLDILSPITGFGFHKEGDLWYDPLVSPFNIFYVYAVLLMLVLIVAFSNRLIKSVRFCLMVAELLVGLVMLFSAIHNMNAMTSFTYVLPIIVVMILLHSKPFNDKTGSLSVDSFESYVNQTVRKGLSMDYMVLKLNLNAMPHMPESLGHILNSFWHNKFKNAVLFNLEKDLFVLAIPRTSKNGDTEEKIKNLIQNEFQKFYAEFQLKYKVIGMFDTDYVQDDADLKGIINYMLLTMDENTVVIVDEKKKKDLKMLGDVRKALVEIEHDNNLEDPRVRTFCQPIRNMKTNCFDTAEALMRLELPGKGMVAPNVFIPLAEYYGHINALTRIMLNKVCMQIHQLEEEGYQFRRISVNFTASDIKKENFCQDVLDIVEKNHVDPSKVGIELTESQNERDFQIVKDKISVLRSHGMTVYLDDIGTGYSNLDRIVRYDVDVVKFDRFFLLEAEKDQKVGQMMRHLSEAFRDLNYSLLYEGVETEANEQVCMDCGADYIQGFKYARPLPMEQMRDFFVKL